MYETGRKMNYGKMLFVAAIGVIAPLCFAFTQPQQQTRPRFQESPQRLGHDFHAVQVKIYNNSAYEMKLFANVIEPNGNDLQFTVPSGSMNYETLSSGAAGAAKLYMFQLENNVAGILPGTTLTMVVKTGMSSWKVFAKINGKWPQVLEVNDRPLGATVTVTNRVEASGTPVFKFEMN